MSSTNASQRHDPLQTLRERAPSAVERLEQSPVLAGTLAAVLAASDFVLDALARDPALVETLCERAAQRLAGAPLAAPVPQPLAPDAPLTVDDAPFMAALRRWRRAELTRIAWRDLAGWAALDETLAELSAAADQALHLALQSARLALTAAHGTPRSAGGEPQSLLIVAMGKLGGGELNFSSDVDLVLLYPQAGETDRTQLSNHEFFTLLAQRVVRLLAQPTAEGFVYRVDLRLRPFGDSGPTVCSIAALEDYLQIHGRDWERYAWVKARPVTAAERWDELFRSTIQPFVYRRYLDFGVLESLRDMKALIEREVRRRDLADDIKLGDGGIREIEFIVQALQLIRGGRDLRLQQQSLRRALPMLAGAKLLPTAAVEQLDAAYVFLRRLENRLQMRADQQVHSLPVAVAERARLAASMGLDGWPALQAQLAAHRERVSEHFRAVAFGGRDAATPVAPAAAVAPLLPLGAGPPELLLERLRELGYREADAAAPALRDFMQSTAVRRLDDIGRRRLEGLLAVLLREVADSAVPVVTLRRLLSILEAIGQRSSYFALLLDHRQPRHRLVRLAEHGEFLTRQIATHPLLLDELIDDRLLEQMPDRATLQADLDQRMGGADPADEEQLLERLCDFQHAALFRIAVADLLLRLPVMQVSDRLTELAELIVERALALAWEQMTARLGTPMCLQDGVRRSVRITVIGYGKLGGRELGYASDLDLVFLHDSSGAQQETDPVGSAASVPIDNQVFFVRFAQRLVHLLTVHSRSGRLYEVDMRLRPSGRAGLLITSIEAFADYQRREAWTFEHQALLHARSVAGAAALRQRFEALRAAVLAHSVHRERLREEVRAMRMRMRQERSHAQPGQVDLKQDAGGIADIEFLAQYWALRWADRYPPVALFSDTIRQLESVGSADLVPQDSIDVLTRAYRGYRTCLHHRALDGLGAVVAAAQFATERAAVSAIWERYLGP